jgi:hypothetical protein
VIGPANGVPLFGSTTTLWRQEKPFTLPKSLLTASQADNTGDDDNHDSSQDDEDDEDETPEVQAAMAVKAWLEAQMIHQIFKLEVRMLREEIRFETTWPVPYDGDADGG